jgi:hypothetical protein
LGDSEWLKWTFGEEMTHTNHFLANEFSERDEINAFAKNASVRRLKTCQDELKKETGPKNRQSYFDVLATHPICVHKDGNIRREATVAAVVMKPREGKHVHQVGTAVSLSLPHTAGTNLTPRRDESIYPTDVYSI